MALEENCRNGEENRTYCPKGDCGSPLQVVAGSNGGGKDVGRYRNIKVEAVCPNCGYRHVNVYKLV